MAKDPAFLFYPGDWLGGTMGMTFEEKGAYLELLVLQFNRGHMTSQVIGQTVGHLWDKIQDKFSQDDAGLWYNKRLDSEKELRKNFTNSRRNNLLGTNQHTKKKKDKVGHTTSRMENENINKDEDIDSSTLEDSKDSYGEWKTKPGKESMNLELDSVKGGAVIQLFKFSKNHDLTEMELSLLWGIFKAQNFTGEKFYASANEAYSHFINWSKTQNVTNGAFTKNGQQKNGHSYKTAGQGVYADRLKQQLIELNGG